MRQIPPPQRGPKAERLTASTPSSSTSAASMPIGPQQAQAAARPSAPLDTDAQQQATAQPPKAKAPAGAKVLAPKARAAQNDRAGVHAAILSSIASGAARYAPDDVSLAALQQEAFARGLPFLVLAHVQKHGLPRDMQPCSRWLSDEETETSSKGAANRGADANPYARYTLFVLQAQTPYILELGRLSAYQNSRQPKRVVTCFLQLNEDAALQESGRDWHLRAVASLYLAQSAPSKLGALSVKLAQSIPDAVRPAVYTDALLTAIADGDVGLGLRCLSLGADLDQASEMGTTPLLELTLHAPVECLEALVAAGATPAHRDALQEAVTLAEAHGLDAQAAVLRAHSQAFDAL